jgi:hypothetical protein
MRSSGAFFKSLHDGFRDALMMSVVEERELVVVGYLLYSYIL